MNGGIIAIPVSLGPTRLCPLERAKPKIIKQAVTNSRKSPDSSKYLANMKGIDPTRLNPGRKKKGDDSYHIKELQSIARNIGLSSIGVKSSLVNRIKDKMIEYGLIKE
jgi:hypothetical protein